MGAGGARAVVTASGLGKLYLEALHQNDGITMTTLTLRLRGLQAEIVESMVEAGLAETRSEAVRIALLQFGRSSGLIDEAALFKALQRAAAEKPLGDREILEGIRRSKRARVPRR